MSNDAKLEILLSARDVSARAFDSIQDHVAKLTDSVFSLSGVLAGAAGAAGFGMLAKGSLDATAELQKNADMAGVTTTAYQELAFAAGAYQVSQDALTDGLKELSLRTDEYVQTGGGSAKEAFERLKFTQQDLNERLSDTPGLLREVIHRMEDLDTAAQIRIADEIFGGTGGEQFVAMIDAGAGAMDKLIRKSRDLGVVIDQSLIKKSIEAKREVGQLSMVLSANFQRTIAELAPDIKDLAGYTSDWVKQNQALVRERVPEFVEDVRDLVGDVKKIYDSIPDEVKGPAGMGLVGAMLMGGKGGVLLGGGAFLFNEFKDFFDGIEGLKVGSISWSDFIGDEKDFESALKRYRKSIVDIKDASSQFGGEFGNTIEQLQGKIKDLEKSTSGVFYFADDKKNLATAREDLKTLLEMQQSLHALPSTAGMKSYTDAIEDAGKDLGLFFSDLDAYEKKLSTPVLKVSTEELKKQYDKALKLAQEYNAKRFALETRSAKEMPADPWVALYAGMAEAATRAEYYQEQETQAAYEAEQKKLEITKEFDQAHKQVTLSAFDFDMDILNAQYAEYDKYIEDKSALDEWYIAESNRIYEQQTKDMLSDIDELNAAFDGWANSFVDDLNEMAWGADLSFNNILTSFGKMLTSMQIQKAASGVMEWSSGFDFVSMISGISSGTSGPTTLSNGATINPSGAVFGMAGGGIINEHVIGLGMSSGQSYEFGEGGVPEAVISSNDWGKSGSREVVVNIIDQRSSDSPAVETSTTQGANGQQQIQVLIRKEVQDAMSNGTMDKSMQFNYGIKRAGIRR